MSDLFGGPENDETEEDMEDEGMETRKVVPTSRPTPLPIPALPGLPGFGQAPSSMPAAPATGPLNIPVPLMIALGIGGIGLLAWFLSNQPSSTSSVGEDEDEDEDEDDEVDGDYDDDDDDLDGEGVGDDDSDEDEEDEEDEDEEDRGADLEDDQDGEEEFSDDPEEGEDEYED